MLDATKILESIAPRELRKRGAYRRLFATEDGQLVLADLCRFAGFDPAIDQCAGEDTHTTSFNLGKERVVKRILQLSRAPKVDQILNQHADADDD